MVDHYSDFVGVPSDDAVQLVIKTPTDAKVIRMAGGYEIKCNVLTQPGSFTFHVGWADELVPLLKYFNALPESDPTKLQPFPTFELHIAGTTVMSGIIEAVNVPSIASTTLEIKGRDWMVPFIKGSIQNELTLQHQTYAELVQKVMDICGVGDRKLLFTNEANRDVITRAKFRKRRAKTDFSKNQLVAEIDTGIQAPGGGKVKMQHLLARVGETWYQWLEKQLQMAGLLLWCSWDGNYVLGSPTIDQPYLYRIVHQKGQTRNDVNVVDLHLNNDYTNQNTTITAYGRYGGGAGGRNRNEATTINVDAYAHLGGQGIWPLVIEDDDIKNNQQAWYRANRAMSEQCRAGFSLQYTLSGHRMPCAAPGHEDEMLIWAPDTIVDVQDDWLGFHELMYVEGVTFKSSPQTTTIVDLVRPRYLAYYGTVEQL